LLKVYQKMNYEIDVSFHFKPESISVKIVHNLLFIEACEYQGEKGVDYTKRFIKNCKRIDRPKFLKAFYKPNKIRITDSSVRKVGEIEIKIVGMIEKPFIEVRKVRPNMLQYARRGKEITISSKSIQKM